MYFVFHREIIRCLGEYGLVYEGMDRIDTSKGENLNHLQVIKLSFFANI